MVEALQSLSSQSSLCLIFPEHISKEKRLASVTGKEG